MKKIRRILSGLKQKLLPLQIPVVEGKLAGFNLKTVKGTLRNVPDQDDAWLFYLMGRFDSIFDIGANIGQSALCAKIQGKNKRLLLADPNPEALSIAAKNLILNGFASRCDFITAFVSDKPDETILFYTIGPGAAGCMFKGHAETAAALGQSMKVPTTTIDVLVETMGWTPDFVKIDVEGAEAKVLQGAVALAKQQQT